jgi:hypothetical protein
MLENYSFTAKEPGMSIPQKREDLVAMGYVFDGEGRCKACGAYMEWWITPRGKKMPMSVVDVKDETKVFPQPVLYTIRVPHWGDCPEAASFRRKT